MILAADRIDLPAYRHVPGANRRHEEGFLDHVIELTPDRTLDRDADENPAWHYGLRLLHHGYYWEAHEVLEAVWLKAAPNSRERHLVQGVIHIANAALKIKMGREPAAQRLSHLALECVHNAFAGQRDVPLLQLNVEVLERNARLCVEQEFAFSSRT